MSTYRKVAATGAVLIGVALAGTGTAFAYWSTGGSGTGTATVATIQPLVVTQVPVQNLLAGKPTALVAKISNVNSFDISVAQHPVTLTPAVDKAHQACDLKNFVLTTPTPANPMVQANSSTDLVGGVVTMLNLPSVNQDVCQGATLTFSYTLSGSAK